METDWSRQQLADWVRGKLLYGRDVQANSVPPPGWLLAASEGLGPGEDSAAALELTHPEDRVVLIGSFVESLKRPGEPVPAQVRGYDLDTDRWVIVDIEWLNLIDHGDVGVLICTLLEVAGPIVVEPDEGEPGDHDHTRWMVFDIDANGVVRSVEGKVRETIGYEPAELVGHLVPEFLHHDTIADAVANWVALKAQRGATSISRRPWVTKDGRHIWLEASYLNRGEDSILAVVWDVTERRAQEQELADLTAQFQMLADEVPAAVFRCDATGTVLFHNARWVELVEDRPGATRLHDLVHPDDITELVGTLDELAHGGHAERRTIDVSSRHDDAVWRVALRSAGDPGAGRTSIVGSIEDVTDTVRLRRAVRRDPLTGLLNRAGIEEQLRQALVERTGATLVGFIDLDGFKIVNDTWGHDAGDAVLIEVGQRLIAALRPGDTVGRYGGDEFVVVCREVTIGDEEGIIHRLEASLVGHIPFDGGQWEPSASLGWARPLDGDDLASVLRRADQAMFAVKRHRKSQTGGAGC